MYLQRCLVVTRLAPRKTAAGCKTANVLCTPYSHAPVYCAVQSHTVKGHVCLAVTCRLHFWQTDRDFFRATAVTRDGTDTEIRVSTDSWPRRRKFSRRIRSERDSNPRLFDHESGALTHELSALRTKCHRSLLKKILLVLWKLIVIHGFE